MRRNTLRSTAYGIERVRRQRSVLEKKVSDPLLKTHICIDR